MLKIHNPATGSLIQVVEADSPTSVAEKFKRAKRASSSWAATPMTTRVAHIRNFKKLILEKTHDLAQILTSEVGKPITQSLNELKGLLVRIDFFIENTERALQEELVFTDTSQNLCEKITHEPLGVIANISAWNYPYFVGSNVFLPALLTGNTVLYKPSEFAILTGLAITRLLHEAGIPEDVFIAVIGAGETGKELLKHPVNGIFFTGSYATGRQINEAAAPLLAKIQLELGGKDPTYVCEDVEVVTAAESLADGAFYNNGQSCCSVERIYVAKNIYEPFLEAFVKTVSAFVVGDPMGEKTYLGPLTRESQIQYLEKQITDALQKGAKLLCGGKRIKRAGNYFEPTVFSHVNHRMDLMREESFGPLIGIQSVSSDEEAISLMNDSPYGLTAGVYVKQENRAKKILTALNAGSVYWNACDRVSPRLPWSGRGHSGMGCTLSHYGIETFLQPKAWHLKTK